MKWGVLRLGLLRMVCVMPRRHVITRSLPERVRRAAAVVGQRQAGGCCSQRGTVPCPQASTSCRTPATAWEFPGGHQGRRGARGRLQPLECWERSTPPPHRRQAGEAAAASGGRWVALPASWVLGREGNASTRA